jgi:hypothetical protein
MEKKHSCYRKSWNNSVMYILPWYSNFEGKIRPYVTYTKNRKYKFVFLWIIKIQ